MPPTAINSSATLPGISFAVVPPPPPQVLPRMDIAGFVGFAASGPIDVPVVVQDSTQFATVFGDDVPIAWDPVHNEQAYGLLGPAVRAFFRNGGQRCWVVRVADPTLAQRDSFELPGVAAVDQAGHIGGATLVASSCGSWADDVSVTAALQSDPVELEQFWLDAMAFSAVARPGPGLNVGDLVRLQFPAQRATLYGGVAALSAARPSPPSPSATVQVTLGPYLWVSPAAPAPGDIVNITYLGSNGTEQTVAGTVTATTSPTAPTRLVFDPALSDPPQPGALVRGTGTDGDLILDVALTEASQDGIVAIDCEALLVGPAPAGSPPSAPNSFAERLTLSLTVSGAAPAPVTAGGLGFTPPAAQFIGALQTDEAYYGSPPPSAWPAPAGVPPTGIASSTFPTAGPAPANFPLAAPETVPAWYVPLALSIAPSQPLGALFPSTPALTRDGLSNFGSGLFLDPALAAEPTSTLLETAAWIRDQSPEARPLQGIHALLDNDEVTLLAVPDAVQRGWTSATVEPAPPPAPPEPVTEPDWSTFLSCSTRVLQAPQFPAPASPPAAGSGALIPVSWTPTDADGATYELQRASDPDFDDAADVYVGPARQFSLSPPPPGSNIYLRVRAAVGALQSAWSSGMLITVAGTERWFLNDPTPGGASAAFSPQVSLDVQTAALRMSAARGDVLALLAMPEHYRTPDAIAHVAALQAGGDFPPGSAPDPLFGFGAIYHPWVYCADPTDPTTFRRTPPDDPAAGIAALRAANRGAWVAPANQPLQDVLALDQPVTDADYQTLANAQINFVRDAPGGFLWLSADTLAGDPDVRPINVRRLLALLRRTAEQYGVAHVFEPNNDLTRRTARRSFQALLGYMFSAGAFAGATPSDAFQVSTPVTPDDLDQGRLVVELRVAPSYPLAFLTILLVQSGTGTVQVITR